MESLQEQRKELNRRLGRLCHKSHVHRLPPEIISNIFDIYVKDWRLSISNAYGPLFLGAICRPWRQLAWKNPNLWTTIDFRFGPEVSFNSFHLAHDWLSRTGHLPLSVRLHQNKNTDHFPLVCHAFVQTILSKYGPFCYSLSLRLPSETLASIDYFSSPESSMLQELEVSSTNKESFDGPTLNLRDHSPTTLTIIRLVLSEVAIDYNKLTSFTGDHMFLGEVVQILKMAPMLKSCTQRAVYHDFIHMRGPLNMEPLIHTDIELFDIDFSCEKRDVERFFEKTTFPRLRNFICVYCSDYFPVDSFIEFIRRSSCSLQQLSLERVPISGQGLIEIAKAAPSIIDFSISCLPQHPPSPPTSCFYHALYVEHPFAEATFDSSEEVLLPMLQRLYINPGAENFTWEFVPGFFGAFGAPKNIQTRPLKEVEISCVDSYPLADQSFHFYGFPFIRRDTLEELQRLEGIDLKLHYRTNVNAPRQDVIEATLKFHETIATAEMFDPELLSTP